MKAADRRARDVEGPAQVQCIVGETLCRVAVLSEAEWDRMGEGHRPATAVFVPGLGWVCALPIHSE